MLEKSLRTITPKNLAAARAVAHRAVQLVTRAARANLDPVPDDSHSNLGWDSGEGGTFLSQPMPLDGVIWHATVSFDPFRLALMSDGSTKTSVALDGLAADDAAGWLDAQLADVGFKQAADVALPYDLPPEVARARVFDLSSGLGEAMATLSSWFGFADSVLRAFAAAHDSLTPGPSPVRCWPHHFDIATYVALESGDAETARGIGIGMSPGDESYDQPYFYVNPWPHLAADDLPALPAPGHWHTQGFVGAIATAEEILSLDAIADQFPIFITGAFALGREKLGV